MKAQTANGVSKSMTLAPATNGSSSISTLLNLVESQT